MFESENGNFDIKKEHLNGKGYFVVSAGETENGIVGKTDIEAKIFEAKTITVDMFGNVFYRSFKYKMVTHARVFCLNSKVDITDNQGLFLVNSMKFFKNLFSYENMCSWAKVKDKTIQLPITASGTIDFAFMEDFIAELEAERIAELEAYLLTTGLKDYILTAEEETALQRFEKVEWQSYNLEETFGKSTRGRRLKSQDRISGNLPFVTAGEANTGISAYIGNDVVIFDKNTTTIDMFGSAKYRNYQYGADDHVAVVHTENLNKFAAVFVTTAIEKSSHAGQFDYSRNFYASNADELYISLPTADGKIDYSFMDTFISAVQKLVIADVVRYADRKIAATRRVAQK